MLCPLKFNNPNKEGQSCRCEQSDCALWNERFGMCSRAVVAYLKGQEDWQKEQNLLATQRYIREKMEGLRREK